MSNEETLDAEIRHTVEAALKYYEGNQQRSAGLLFVAAGLKSMVLNATSVAILLDQKQEVNTMDDALEKYKEYIAHYGEHPKPKEGM